MSKIGTWSTTPANNNSTPPNGWPEGQAPSTVNDCAREMMAQIKTVVNSIEYIDYANTPSFLTATTFSMATADVANFEIGRRVKLFDATTLYGTILSVSSTFVQVQLDAGALTAQLSSVAMSAIKNTNNSLPATVYRNTNYVINGQMDMWSRGLTFPTIVSGQYSADCFQHGAVNTAVVNVSRSQRADNASNVPSLAQVGHILNSSLEVYVSAVDATIAIGDYSIINYYVEGFDWRHIAHKPFTLDFWAHSNIIGTYAITARNLGGSVSYVQNFTIGAASTWAHFTMEIPAAPTTPYTWNYDNGMGLELSWVLAGGATYQATANQWTAMNALCTTSQVNFLGTVGATFKLANVSLREGYGLRPMEPRYIAEEASLAQRYYQVLPNLTANGTTDTGPARAISFPTGMRQTPIVTATTAAGAGSTLSFYDVTSTGFRYKTITGAGATDFTVTIDATF